MHSGSASIISTTQVEPSSLSTRSISTLAIWKSAGASQNATSLMPRVSQDPVALGIEAPELTGPERPLHLRRLGVLGQPLGSDRPVVPERERLDVGRIELVEHIRRVRGRDDLEILEFVQREEALDHAHQLHL